MVLKPASTSLSRKRGTSQVASTQFPLIGLIGKNRKVPSENVAAASFAPGVSLSQETWHRLPHRLATGGRRHPFALVPRERRHLPSNPKARSTFGCRPLGEDGSQVASPSFSPPRKTRAGDWAPPEAPRRRRSAIGQDRARLVLKEPQVGAVEDPGSAGGGGCSLGSPRDSPEPPLPPWTCPGTPAPLASHVCAASP